MASLSLKNVKKIYDKNIVAVQEFNLEIADKEFVVFVGPSGCGKSTTLRMIAGLEEISEGELCIGGNCVNETAPKDRDIAMVFQNYALYPHMTVYENMAFALKMKKMDKEMIKEKVEKAAKVLNITEYLDRKPKALSGGQRQRVAIGRAIVRNPQVFLMDEPLSNLDAKLRNQTRAEIIKLRKKIDTTFVYVTHDQTEAMTLGDRIVIMKDGFIQQIGTPQEVYRHPYNMFVAGFIGTPQMNVFDAELVLNNDTYMIQYAGKMLPLADKIAKNLKEKNIPAQKIKMGVRPEHIELVETATPNSLEAAIVVSELMGNEVYLHTEMANQNHETIIRVATKNDDSIAFETNVLCEFPPDCIHMFHPETGINILSN